jgi:hypothetical protein
MDRYLSLRDSRLRIYRGKNKCPKVLLHQIICFTFGGRTMSTKMLPWPGKCCWTLLGCKRGEKGCLSFHIVIFKGLIVDKGQNCDMAPRFHVPIRQLYAPCLSHISRRQRIISRPHTTPLPSLQLFSVSPKNSSDRLEVCRITTKIRTR